MQLQKFNSRTREEFSDLQNEARLSEAYVNMHPSTMFRLSRVDSRSD